MDGRTDGRTDGRMHTRTHAAATDSNRQQQTTTDKKKDAPSLQRPWSQCPDSWSLPRLASSPTDALKRTALWKRHFPRSCRCRRIWTCCCCCCCCCYEYAACRSPHSSKASLHEYARPFRLRQCRSRSCSSPPRRS